MPAGIMPKSAPETKIVPTPKAETSVPTKEVVKEVKAKEPELDQTDLDQLEEGKKVPYNRFKEVNDERKNLSSQIDELKNKYESEMQTQARMYEAKLKASEEPYETVDEVDEVSSLKKEIDSLKTQINHVVAQTRGQIESQELERLLGEFPDADKNAVLGWRRVMPKATLRELVEHSHNELTERVNSKIKAILEEKKKRITQQKIPVARGTSIKINSTERPKNISDAGRLARQFLAEQQ